MLDIKAVPKVSFISLGCPKNLVDSEVMLGKLVKSGFYICEDHEDSDIIVINTCGFLQEAEREALDVINQARDLKKSGKIHAIVVAGCLPQRYGPNISQKLEDVDAIIGLAQRDRIGQICIELFNSGLTNRVMISSEHPNYVDDTDRLRITPRHYAYVRIADGCNHDCSFCIIPQIKGRFRSKPKEEILREVNELTRDGAVEIILIAQDTTEYGQDLYGKLVLHELIDMISQIDSIKWIRLLYCYPTMLTDQIIDTIAQNPKVVKYVDMPIQHTRECILRLMKRGVTEKYQKDLIQKLRSKIEGLFLRTAVITGFPQETEEDFQGLLEDLEKFRFERLGTFVYSREPGTYSDTMSGHLSDEERYNRFNKIMMLQQKIAFEKARQLVGKVIETIVDRKLESHEVKELNLPESRQRYYMGRTYGDAPDVDAAVYIKGDDLSAGDIIPCKITASKDYDLIGHVNDFSK